MKGIRRRSIKFRIMVWYAVFVVLIVALFLGMLLAAQDISSEDFYSDKLREALQESDEDIETLQDALEAAQARDSGVRLTVVAQDGTLLAGDRTFHCKLKEDSMRIRADREDNFWFVMDRRIELRDGGAVWLRGYISSEVSERYYETVLHILLYAVPVLLLVVLGGGYLLTKRAFRPLDDIINAARDISARTDLRQRFRTGAQRDEVGRLADALDGMLDRLERSMEDERTFISDASHELRTPISVIRAQSEFALKPGRTPAEKDAALEIIQTRSIRAGQMLSQMLLLSRMDYERLPLNPERVNLSELLRQVAQEMELRAGERDIALLCDVEEGVCCRCDELLMMRAVSNLLENAIQYGRPGGHIWLALRGGEERLTLTVRDDGIGIAEADQPKIWQRFYRVNKSGGSGYGLGLSIVQWIVRAHGGDISVTSAPGVGSTFALELPVDPGSARQ